MFPAFAQKKKFGKQKQNRFVGKKKFELISCIEIFVLCNLLYIIEVFSHQGSTILFFLKVQSKLVWQKKVGKGQHR